MRTGLITGVAATAVLAALVTAPVTAASASSPGQDFEGFSTGSVNGQSGWSVTGPAFDFAVADTTGAYGGALGARALRVSNAVTSGSFGDQLFSQQTPNEAGETSAQNGGLSGGTRQNRYSTSFTFASVTPGAEQPGLVLGVSPDRGDGARMSLVRLYDTPTGLKVTAFGFNTDDAGDFPETVVAADLPRAVPHSLSLTMDLLDGPSNDRVSISVDGAASVVIGSWEQYFRDGEGNPTRTVDSLLFRASIASPNPAALLGKGFYIDSVVQSTSATPAPVMSSRTVTPTALATHVGGWQAFKETDWPSSATGRFVAGPVGAAGASSLRVSLGPVTGANNGKYYLGRSLPGVRLGDLTGLRYRVLTDPANGGVMQPYVNIPVSGGGVTYANLVYDPNDPASNPEPLPSSNGVWRTFDPFSPTAKWHATREVAGKSVSTSRTLSEWLQLAPDLTTHAVAGGVYVVFGASQVSPAWTDYVAYLDSFSLTVAGAGTTDSFDRGAPLSPTSVVVGAVRPRSATVAWVPDAGTSLAPVDSYEVVVDGTPQSVPSTATSLDISPLAPGSGHRVSIRAVRGADTGPAVAVSFQTPAIPVPATVSGLAAARITATSAALSWSADPTVGDGVVDGYEVSLTPTGGTAVVPAATHARALVGLAPGVTYTATLRAHNESGWSNPVSVTFTASDLDRRTPGTPDLTVGDPGPDGDVPVSWVPNAGDSVDFPVQHWIVAVDGADEAYLPAATTSYSVAGLGSGRHTVAVRGANALGSEAFAARTLVIPASTPAEGPQNGPVSTAVLTATPKVITYGASSALRATFTQGTAPVAGTAVVLASAKGTAWVSLTSGRTGADGSITFTVRPSATTRYRVLATGQPSATAIVSVHPRIVTKAGYTSARGRTTVRLTAVVAPRMGGAVVRLQKLVGTTWRTVSSKWLSARSAFVFTIGTYASYSARYRIQVPATATSLASASASTLVRVSRR